jgi:hypothetical protein
MVNPQQVEGRVAANESILNPTDLGMMVQDKRIDPNMSVDDFMRQIGVDPQGPVTQLITAMGKQSQMANPANKMRAIAGVPQAPPQGAPQGPAARPGLRGLLG